MEVESGIGDEEQRQEEVEEEYVRGEEEEEEEEGGMEEDGTNAEKGTDQEAGQVDPAAKKQQQTSEIPMANNRKNCATNANGGKATGAATGGSSANALTVEKYLMHLRQKEERIRQLEEENRTLKSALLDKSRAYQAQVDQLTGELVRNAEMVARLQSELALNKGASIITHSSPVAREFPHQKKPRKGLSVVHPHSKQQQPLAPSQLVVPQHNGHSSVSPLASTRPPAAKAANAPSPLASKCVVAAHQPQASTSDPPPDDICAALQHFVERNRTNQPQQQQNGAGVVEAIMGVLKGGHQAESTSTTQPTAATAQPAAEEEEQFLAAQLLSGLLFGSDSSQQHKLLDTTSVSAAATGAENGEVNSLDPLDPTSLFALSMLFDEMAANDGERQQNSMVRGQQQTGGTHNSTGIKREAQLGQQQQQNIDFEEVMQRVIGGTSASTRRGTVTSIGDGTRPLSSVAVASPAPLIGPKGTGKAAKKKGSGKSKAPAGIGTPSLRFPEGGPPSAAGIATTVPTMVTDLPKGSSTSVVGRKSLSSHSVAVGVPLLKADQFSPHSNGANHSTPPVQKPWSPDELKLVKQLEARIDENIAKLGPCPLNTAELAAQCTRLMRGYSIGQRLFARTVMVQVSQSQGSLSELLSKPRPWHKLTDKGREAFRRIFGWISDDVAIDLLCQLSPRKVALTEKLEHPDPQSLIGAGDQSGDICAGAAGPNLTSVEGGISMVNVKMELAGGAGSGVGRGGKRALKSTNAFANAPPSKRVAAVKDEAALSEQSPTAKFTFKENGSGTAPVTLSTPTGGGGGRWRHDDIPKEKIIDIYEAEKAKLLEQECHLERPFGLSSASPSISPPPPARPATTVPMAPPFGGQSGGRKHFQRAGSAFSVGMGVVDERSLSSVCSPSSTVSADHAQQMVARHWSRSSELPPVQFDRYPALDTEEVVRQIRERLIDGQISQHQFGKTVLGLSQGSVSDLLARPKAWNSLTNKGREPFIRMQIFLEDKKAIKLEVNSESDGEAMECGGAVGQIRRGDGEDGTEEPRGEETDTPMGSKADLNGGDDTSPSENSVVVPTTTTNRGNEMVAKLEEGIGKVEGGGKEAEEGGRIGGEAEREGGEAAEDGQMPRGEGKSNRPAAAQHGTERQKSTTPKVIGKTKTYNPTQTQQSSETADEVDTADVARRVRAVLADNGFSQRAFGEHILKTTSGCVSDLLAKPKPWVMLSYKGRESYTKMVAFLDDPDSVDRLKADEEQRCAMNSALNALKAIGGADSEGAQQRTNTGDYGGSHGLSALEALTAMGTLSTMPMCAASPCAASSATDPSPPPLPSVPSQQPNVTNSALQLIAGLASGELGSNTPIGTLLRKTNAPSSPNSAGTMMSAFPSALKRKGGPCPSGASVSPLSMVSLDKSADCPSATQIGPLVHPPAKKIPRFQRTIITDRQKEALLFIFAHEQRPNSRCIEQLALKLGLTPRTVTNWFHNYRTRQKAKETKPENVASDDASVPPPATSVPTPAQILARALNASDSKTTGWFRELAELLRMHSDASVDVDSIGGSRCSVGTASVASSPPSPANVGTTVVAIQLMGDEGQIDTATEEEEEETGANDGEGQSDGEGSEEVTEETRDANNVSPSLHSLPPTAAGGRQLDKAIARMHSRLLTGLTKGQ